MSEQKQTPDSRIDPIEDVIAALQAGEIVIVVDDESRENEGDLICAAEKATPDLINFMARKGCGLICLAMRHEDLARLGLSRMIPYENGDKYRTAFMESVDARHGITTGISAGDRAHTIQTMMGSETRHADLVRPGHIFPLEAKPMGVLQRAGHTEAAVDLSVLAGLKPAGVICEILREDGSMARMPDLLTFKQEYGIKMTTVADIITYRHQREVLVQMQSEIQMPTDVGTFQMKMYEATPNNEHHLALVMGDPANSETPPLVRVHSECLTGDVFSSQRCDCGTQLKNSMANVAEEGCGIIVYMRQEGRGIGLAHKIHAYALQDQGLDTVEANEELGFDADLRDYGMAAQILRDLQVTKVRLLTNNPAKVEGLERYGVQVSERVGLTPAATEHNLRYLATKKSKMGHLL